MNRVDNWKKLASPEPCVVCGLDTWAMTETRAVHMHCSTLGVCLDDRTTRAVRTSDITVAGERVATWEYWGERRDEANTWGVLNPMPWCATFVSGVDGERASFDHWSRGDTTLPCPPESTFSDVMNHRGLVIGHTRREVDEAIKRITLSVQMGRGMSDLREVIVRHGGYIDRHGEIVWPRQDIALLPNQHEMLRGHDPGSPGAIVEANNRVLSDAMHYEYEPVGPLNESDFPVLLRRVGADADVKQSLRAARVAITDALNERRLARGGFVDAIGQWPGDESDDEVNAGLRDVE